ncbi:MAG: [FeFe] hydrogenase H-cluster maturation GTPase HydF [Eubacteriales bacterium]
MMSLNQTPVAERLHISIFGRRNVGKSSLINALTDQKIALVSEVAGTTTDPVYKTMELLPIGPVVITDTAGIDDMGELGQLRVERTIQVLNKTDLAVLVIEPEDGVTGFESELVSQIKARNIPAVAVLNKTDLLGKGPAQTGLSEENPEEVKELEKRLGLRLVLVSALTGEGIDELKRQIILMAPDDFDKTRLVSDLVKPGDLVVLVVPIDKSAPKGRLILPQQQVIRELIESGAIAVVTREHELKETLNSLGRKPSLVITDSQAFEQVSADTPKSIPLTSFSILFARYKGELVPLIKGVKAVRDLKPDGKILIVEGCTHHRQADDIARVKIPRWLRQKAGDELTFEWANGTFFPQDLTRFDLVVHCGGCMLNPREMKYRIACCRGKRVPIVNYGMLIAYVHGILERALEPFRLAAEPSDE